MYYRLSSLPKCMATYDIMSTCNLLVVKSSLIVKDEKVMTSIEPVGTLAGGNLLKPFA